MHSYAADPEGTRKRQAEQVLRSIGALDAEGQVRLLPLDSKEVASVKSVFPRVLRAARETVGSLIHELEERTAQTGPDSADRKRMDKLLRAKVQLDAWQDDGFLVVDVNTPNAFVHALVPRLIFIHRGLFWTDSLSPASGATSSSILAAGARVAVPEGGQLVIAEVVGLEEEGIAVRFCDGAERCVPEEDIQCIERKDGVIQTDEQLAMLLGHELSHVVHDHAEGTASVLGVAAGCQLVLLSLLDPTGLLSFLAEIGMGMTANYGLRLPHSRANELEADGTGLQICARALYDPRDAASFFGRMLAHEAAPDAPGWASTHPRTEHRLLALRDAEDEAVSLFEQAKARAGLRQAR